MCSQPDSAYTYRHKAACVVGAIRTQSHTAPLRFAADHGCRRVAFCRAAGLCQTEVDDQAVADLRQYIAQIAQLCFRPRVLYSRAIASVTGSWVLLEHFSRCQLMGRVAALVRWRRVQQIVIAILPLKALLSGPRFNQRAVHREVFI